MTSYNHGVACTSVKAGVPNWQPNQLRYTHATTVRRRFGLEVAQVMPARESADATQVYAEKNLALVAKIAA